MSGAATVATIIRKGNEMTRLRLYRNLANEMIASSVGLNEQIAVVPD